MAKPTREDLLSRQFMDPKNYPYGFSRSGDFSINEAKALAAYGNLISALLSGSIGSTCAEDEQLIAVAKGERQPSTAAEKAWLKYQARIHRSKTGSIYGKSKSTSADSDSDTDDIDDEPLDSDIEIAEDED